MYIPDLNRKITLDELLVVKNHMEQIGIKNGYFQELGSHEEEYVPNF